MVTGAEGENESSADPPSARLSSLSAISTCSLHLHQSPLSCLALFVLVWQRDEDVHIVEGEEPRLAAQHALVPVLVDLIGQGYDVALAEAQLALVLRIEVVERLTARLLRC